MSTTAVRKPLTFRPLPENHQRLNALAQETNRPVSFYLNEMLGEYLDHYERAYRIQQEAQDIRAGKVKTRPLGEFMEELGIH